MEQVFELKVKEKRKKLRDSDVEFNRKFDLTMKTLDDNKREIEERRKKFEQERDHFGKIHAAEEMNGKQSKSSSFKVGGDKKEKKEGIIFVVPCFSPLVYINQMSLSSLEL